MTPPDTFGEVITFYSYKGGTGRSMALANVAVLLTQAPYHKKVLMIDWDLEAPGLHRYFRDRLTNQFASATDFDQALDRYPGLIELMQKCYENTAPDSIQEPQQIFEFFNQILLDDYILKTDLISLDLMKAGKFDENYSKIVNQFPWEELHQRSPWLMTVFAEWLMQQYDYVLIDSRTGFTDISGICTMLLPEKLVVVFTPNRQSLTGIMRLVKQAVVYRNKSDDVRPLTVFPLPSRIDLNQEELYKDWRFGNTRKAITGYQTEFESILGAVYQLEDVTLKSYFDEVQISYMPDYAYGEEIAVLTEGREDSHSMTRSYRNFATSLIEHQVPWKDALSSKQPDLAETLSPEPAEFLEFSESQQRRLRDKHFELNSQYELISEKIKRIRTDYAIVTDPSTKFQLEMRIKEEEKNRREIEKELENLEQKLKQVQVK